MFNVFLCLASAGTRSVPMDEKLYTDFGKTALSPDEVLLSVDIPDTKTVRTRFNIQFTYLTL